MLSISEVPVEKNSFFSHRSSKHAVRLGWNFFFICHIQYSFFRVCGGLNLQRHLSLTIATLYCWLDLLDQDKTEPWFAPYKLWRVTVTEYDVLRYSAVRNGLPLDASSMEFVQPGDYAAYSGSYDNQLHGRHINGNGVGEPWPSFHE
ncbi:uncharacterized protein LACBIDRAFT_301717 [Laccaria bicolor S238N-H82]|uniref:Predicted protein n=1 Tax=Laccaria bicolor (strain S238N-H82 / ATCC MYA-4686) TaxID=486041 RepID=B0CP42_LACBS|nr:uncharacterized protein LACBIDRAFT_301717 [Laccaria bicolor S238N-H82]EDR16042.1 predicted protein [Laccaria bicolor S238N-H82]|eukprot:XP_001874250.1 predicted protein [Laccaria bicolor S238N-H82]